jgi:hypothetical protein
VVAEIRARAAGPARAPSARHKELSMRMFIVLMFCGAASTAHAFVQPSGFLDYQGFRSQGGAANGLCAVAASSGVTLVSCDVSTNGNFYFPADNWSGEIALIDNPTLCLDIDPIFEIVIVKSCASATTQQWTFSGGLVHNRGTGQCWVASGGGIGVGSCAPVGNSANLWMPVQLPMAIYSAPSNLVVTDKQKNFNTDAPALDLQSFVGFYVWQAQLWYQAGAGIRTLLVSKEDGYVADVYGAIIRTNGSGVVDLATANGTLAQHWYFATESTTPQGSPLIMSGVAGGGYCLDVKDDNQISGTNLDVYLCDSQYGTGNNPAQLWQAVLDDLPAS